MKLFFWNKPYQVNYGCSMVFAVAKNLEAAKQIARSQQAKWYSYGDCERDSSSWPHDLGEPTRIVALPCAEWHEWSE